MTVEKKESIGERNPKNRQGMGFGSDGAISRSQNFLSWQKKYNKSENDK